MSWLTGLADKAETLLNKIDQNAAAVLQEKDKRQSPSQRLFAREESSRNSSPLTVKVDPNLQNPDSFRSKTELLKSANETNGASGLNKAAVSQNSSVVDFSYMFESEEHGENTRNDSIRTNLDENDGGLNIPTINGSENEQESNLMDVENQMLRNEIFEVNNEASILLTKLKNTEKINNNLKVKISQLETSYSTARQENDILSAKINALNTVKERKKSFRDEEVSDLESTIKQLEQDKINLSAKVRELEGFKVTYSSMKSELENSIDALKDNCGELENQLKLAKEETVNAVEELKNYKTRASTTLAMKDKIIENLKCESSQEQAESAVTAEINQLKMECENLNKEAAAYQLECESKCREVVGLEIKLKNLDKLLLVMRENYQREKTARELSEHTVNSLTKELKNLQIETGKQLSSLRSKLRDNQFKENNKLQSTSHDRNNLKVAESGDDRYRSLTQALIAKQTALESVTADRNALKLQLEKTETKYRSDLISIRNNQPRLININDTDDVKSRMPLLQESPWDSRLSRRVKKAYSSLDSFGVRIGVFLRRNPIARIFILAYMIILHLWVMVVLFTYKPEIH